jgi:hypothetical protein
MSATNLLQGVGPNRLFDPEVFRTLPDDRREAVFRLVQQRNQAARLEHWELVDADDLTVALNIYRSDAGGCVPDDEMGDDVAKAIEAKFYDFMAVVRELAEVRLRRRRYRPAFNIIVWPSYEDSTVSIIYDRDKPLLYLWHCHKAWTFNFSTVEEMAEELLRLAGNVERSYARFSKIRRRLPTLFSADGGVVIPWENHHAS